MQEFRPEDEPRESTADPGDPFVKPAPEAFPEAPAVFPEAATVFPEAATVFPETPAPAVLPEAVVFADPGDENPAPYSPAADPFARPAFTPLPLQAEPDQAHVMRRLEVWRDEFFAWVRTLASAAVYATLIVTFGFQVARVEGQSMAPTLADQDRLIVNKLRYRLTSPQRGDIVMLYYPLNPDKSFVKRVIAEEGDTVRVVDGRVYVNDVPMRDDFVPAEYRSHDDWGPQVIPEGYYFVMGDHRNNSSDSRHWGFVPKKYIIGKVQVRWWPVPHARVF